MNSYTVKIGTETEAVKLHMKFYTFSTEYILCVYPQPNQKKKNTTELEVEKQLALYSFITCAHYPNPLPPFRLIFHTNSSKLLPQHRKWENPFYDVSTIFIPKLSKDK